MNNALLSAAYDCASTMKTKSAQVPVAKPANKIALSHVIPLRSGWESRRASKGGVLPALRAALNPPTRDTAATASHTAGIFETPTSRTTWSIGW